MSVATRSRLSVCAVSLLLFACLLITGGEGGAQQQSQGTASSNVYRGALSGGIWLELADDGAGRAELAILDGLPGGTPETRFIALSARSDGGGCTLVASEFGVNVTPCPRGGSFNAQVSLGGPVNGSVLFQAVGGDGSFAWGAAASGTGDVKRLCAMASLSRISALGATPFGVAIANVVADVQTLPSTGGGDVSNTLARLRADRLRAYDAMALTPAEVAEANFINEAVAGRRVNGRTVALAEATRQKMEFDQRMAANPQRARARADLLQVDRQLAAIYDTASGVRRLGVVTRLRNQGMPAADRALATTLATGQPNSVNDLLALDAAVSELDSCRSALGDSATPLARTRVRAALTSRAGEIATALNLAMQGATDASAARNVLQRYESNGTVVEALQAGGHGQTLANARARVSQLAQTEERISQEAQRAAQRQAALDALPPTTSGGRFQADRVSRSVLFIYNRLGDRRGGTGSGFLVAPEVVVTNVHVVEGNRGLLVVPNGAHPRDGLAAQVIAQYPQHDIAILRVPGLQGRTLSLASREVPQGADVWAFGFPGLAEGMVTEDRRIASLTKGIVSRVIPGQTLQSRGTGNTRLVQHDATISPGNSGGPLFDACHRVVGVNTQLASRGASSVLYSVSSAVLPDLLLRAGVTPNISGAACN